jgi:hypothetical protein
MQKEMLWSSAESALVTELRVNRMHTGAVAAYGEVDPTTLHDMKTTLTAAAALLGALTALSIPAAAFASTPATPAGVIHVYVTDSSTQGNNHKILITGAFSDHGTGNQATFYLTKGWIYLNLAGVQKIINSSSFGSFNAASCSYWGSTPITVPIVKGTGAYTGIKGTFTGTLTLAGQGSVLANGKCNMTNNAPSVASAFQVSASANVSF